MTEAERMIRQLIGVCVTAGWCARHAGASLSEAVDVAQSMPSTQPMVDEVIRAVRRPGSN
jgi:hypothetical protein